MSKLKPLLIPTLTFLLGLTAGALVFSAPNPPQPVSDEPVAEDSPPPSKALSVESAPDEPTEPAADAAPAADREADTPPAAVEPPPALVARVEEITTAWGRMQAELAELRQRVVQLERRPPAVSAAEETAEPARGSLAQTVEQQRDALVSAGVPIDTAEELLWRRGQVSLQRLELRDQAIREGWLNSDRYRQELQRINAQRVSLRDEVGPDAYDRFLYETGVDNRVRVDAVIPGSAGDQNGLLPGDVVERYADAPIFDARDLRSATSNGERGELVPVQVRRDGGLVEVWLPRGPIGIQLDSARVEPRG